jgi:hypothetical protein
VSLASTLFGVGPSGERQDHGAPARSELWLAPAVLRVGRFKLMATNPGTRGMVGAHLPGGWITDPSVDPGWARNLSSSNGAAHCGQLAKNDTSVVRKSAALNWQQRRARSTGKHTPRDRFWQDAFVCRACNPPHTPPCLFDVENDFKEKHDLASALPDVVQRLMARLAVLQNGTFRPQFPADNQSEACARLAMTGGYFSPLDYVPVKTDGGHDKPVSSNNTWVGVTRCWI